MVTIDVSEDVWRQLILKKNPGDSFDDVLRRELSIGRQETKPPEPDTADETDPYADLSFPQGVDRDAALAAIEAAVAYVREEHEATKQEIVRAVMPDHELKYDYAGVAAKLDAGDRYRGAWWRKVVKRGLEATPEIAKPKPGHSEWRWVGEDG
jgi:hypothetical protein